MGRRGLRFHGMILRVFRWFASFQLLNSGEYRVHSCLDCIDPEFQPPELLTGGGCLDWFGERGLVLGFAGESMHVARFLFACPARKQCDKRRTRFLIGVGLCVSHALKHGLDGRDVIEVVETLGAIAKLADGLRATQEKQAQQGNFRPAQVEKLPRVMLEFDYAAVVDAACEVEVFKVVERVANRSLVELHDGLTAGFLVARIHQRIQ